VQVSPAPALFCPLFPSLSVFTRWK
jgi:hypothetical protein